MSSVERIIADRTAEKDIRMSGSLVMTKEEWMGRGGEYRGSVWEANSSGYYTVRQCENMAQPVRSEELDSARDFAMIRGICGVYIMRDGRQRRPCIPVFYREITHKSEEKNGLNPEKELQEESKDD